MKKSLFLATLVSLGMFQAISQSNAKWSRNGDNLNSGDFIGSTNTESLVLKANNITGLKINPNGSLVVSSLDINNTNGPNGLVLTDALGKISRSDLTGNSSDFLTGTGAWSKLPPIPPQTWNLLPSKDIFFSGAKVGIGTSTPHTDLDVIGNVSVSGDLSSGKLILGNKYAITFKPGTGSTPAIFGFGPVLPGPVLPPAPLMCGAAITVPTINQFAGLIQSYGYAVNGGYQNVMTMGYDGANNIIETEGNNDDGFSPRLLMNYHCGRDIFMCTGGNGGNVNICNGGNTTGAVYMGTTHIGNMIQATGPHTNALLTVNGKMVAKSCYITLSDWADYVFDAKYNLPKLNEIESYYKTNKHLPEIPSEKEIKENGVDIGEMNKLLLKKVEELTIYLVEQNKSIEILKKEIEELKSGK